MPSRTRTPKTPVNPIEDKLLELLAKIDRPSDFCTSGQCSSANPGLTVHELGDFGLPLSATEAKRLIKVCKQAPYGKGTETVVDTSVRKVWELAPKHFALENPKWQATVKSALREIETELGLPQKSLAARLYKLLVYEQGGFFLPHRDGEKANRMVATLVIALPSKHTGGELIVLHQGRQKVITMPGAASGQEADFAAFYADCQHEVKPILSGYRLCLTYNLVLAKPRSKVAVAAPNFDDATQQITSLLSHWETESKRDDSLPTKLAVMLEHRYTESGLSIDKLKGADLAKANVLFDAAEAANCDAYLALVTLYQSGSSEGDDDDEDDDDGFQSNHRSRHVMGEIFDCRLTANHWSNRQGKRISLGEIVLEESEVLPPDALTKGDPSREDFEGYTGNAGMTLERWYHFAAIVLWPRSNRFQVWCNAGTDAALAELERMVTELRKAKKGREERLADCQNFAAQIIATWENRGSAAYLDRSQFDATRPRTSERNSIWKSMAALGEPRLVERIFEEVMLKDATLSLSPTIIKWVAEQGWSSFAAPLVSLMLRTTKVTLARDISALRQLATFPGASTERKTLCKRLAAIVEEAIERIDSSQHGSWHAPKLDRKETIIDVVQSLLAIGDHKLLSRFLTWQESHPRYDVIEVQVPAAIKLSRVLEDQLKKNRPIRNWVDSLLQELLDRTESAPQKPTDWKRDCELPCNCRDCQQLSAFLSDPTLAEARFPLAKQRRQHLHGIIDRCQCDCTHTTLRVGSPEVLVCKKTTASYQRAYKTYEQDQKRLAAIKEISSNL